MQCPTPNPFIFESDKLDEHLSALEGDQPIALFGLKALNDILGGVHPGLNYAIGTGPGKGKTTLHGSAATSSPFLRSPMRRRKTIPSTRPSRPRSTGTATASPQTSASPAH